MACTAVVCFLPWDYSQSVVRLSYCKERVCSRNTGSLRRKSEIFHHVDTERTHYAALKGTVLGEESACPSHDPFPRLLYEWMRSSFAENIGLWWPVFFSSILPSDIMANVAGFMAYNVRGAPPGLHPAPSRRLALWDTLVVDAIQNRAATMIQQQWRKKLERAIARALAHVARLQM